jgi:hypothetical protein
MQAIEPNWISLLWFAAFATIGTVALLVVAGMFPLRARPGTGGSGKATLLVLGNAILLAALLIGTGLYGYAQLRWSTLVIVAGVVVLFAPGLFEAWPSSWRDGNTGLVVLVGVQALAIATLATVAGTPWANLL